MVGGFGEVFALLPRAVQGLYPRLGHYWERRSEGACPRVQIGTG
jgi:hypothetical protein